MSVARVGHFPLDRAMMPHTVPRRVVILTIALLCVPGMSMARAQDASAWDTVSHGAARLIAGAMHKSGNDVWLRAGIEIRLDPGWHTYWRYPGDSGVPPTFDFAGSENVQSVAVLWPAPKRFVDSAGGHSIGYFGDVTFPLRITALDTTKPSSLHLKLGYAVCGKFCIPADTNLEITLSGKSSGEEPALVAAEGRVPRRVALDTGIDLVIRSVHREGGNEHHRVAVEVAAPEGAPVDLFVEGPTPDWALPLPDPIDPAPSSPPGVRRFNFDLVGLPPGTAAHGARLTFTAVSPRDSIEVSAPLD
jgi:DsbC/DsbD-like thiol-disulfide interchange protein